MKVNTKSLPWYSNNLQADVLLTQGELATIRRQWRPNQVVRLIRSFTVYLMLECVFSAAGAGQFMIMLFLATQLPSFILLVYALFKSQERDFDKAAKYARMVERLEWLNPVNVLYTDLAMLVQLTTQTLFGQLVDSQVLWQRRIVNMQELDDFFMREIKSCAGVLTESKNNSGTKRASLADKVVAAVNSGYELLLCGEFEKSLLRSREALELIGKRNFRSSKRNACINAARAAIRLGLSEESENLLCRATDLSASADDAAEVHLGYAELRLYENRLEEALLYGESACDWYATCKWRSAGERERVYSRRLLASIREAMGDQLKANELRLRADFDEQLLIEDNEAELWKVRKALAEKAEIPRLYRKEGAAAIRSNGALRSKK